MTLYLILLVFLIGLFVCLWNGTFVEGFGSGVYTSDGYYRVSWSAPSNSGGENVTYNLKITDGSGNVIDNHTGITNTYYDFKDGEWSTDYNVEVTASNSAGTGDAAKAAFTSGGGPNPAIIDFNIGSYYSYFNTLNAGTIVSAQPTVSSFSYRDDYNSRPIGFIVEWDDSLATAGKLNSTFGPSVKTLNTHNTQFIPGTGDLQVSLNGTYTSVNNGNTTLSFADGTPYVGTNNIYIYPGSSITNPGFISLVSFDNYTTPFSIMGGDKFDIELTFTNQWGSTKVSKTFTINAITPAAPSAVKVEWKSS